MKQNVDPRPAANCIAPGTLPIVAVPALVASRRGRGFFGAAADAAIVSDRSKPSGRP